MGAKAKAKRDRARAAVQEAAPAVEVSRFAAFERHPAAYLLASCAILAPCYWQSRIQAGDLSSHLYNAWLAQLISKGQAPGLAIVPQTTNILFDLLLEGLFRAFGPAAAQRIAVSLAVLVFFWGAFAFVAAVSRRPWRVTPAIAMLTYGWVFHMGFLNFYLSLGLCFWAMAVAWNGPSARALAAIPLLALAYLAHGLGVAWAIGVLGYAYAWRSRFRWPLFLAALAGIAAMSAATRFSLQTRWLTAQIYHMIGADQLWVFGHRYLWIVGGLAVIWIWIAIDRRRGVPVKSGPLLSVYALTAAGIAAIPTVLWLPHYQHVAFIADRMSLPLGILVCAVLAGGRVRGLQTGAMALVAVIFFGFLYADEAVLNQFEDEFDRVVSQIPPGQRVVVSLIEEGLPVNPVSHMIDRACIGRCWSYANYEPSSGQFRIHAVGDAGLVTTTSTDVIAFQTGNYIVRPQDLPLFQILPTDSGGLVVRQPPAGARLGVRLWRGL